MRDEKAKAEFAVLETGQETVVEADAGSAACGGGLTVAAPGLRFASSAKPTLERPIPATTLAPTATKAGPGSVEINWTKPREPALAARLEIAHDPAFVAPVEIRHNADEKVRVTLPPGRYFWRVIRIGSDGVWSVPSATHSFAITAEAAP